jgi:hypothetical protein
VRSACRHDTETQDKHNRGVDRLLKLWLKDFPGGYDDTTCAACTWDKNTVTLVGDQLETFEHITQHMLDRQYPYGLLRAAIVRAGYGTDAYLVPYRGANEWGNSTIKRALRRYVRERLYLGAVATQSGRHPATAPLTRSGKAA